MDDCGGWRVVGIILLSLASCAYADELQLDYSSIHPTYGGSLGISQKPKWSEREIIVKFGSSVSEDQISAILRQYGCSGVDRCRFAGLQLIQVPESTAASEMVEVFASEPTVEYAELNYYARVMFVPDDTYYTYQWHLSNAISGGIGTESAWDVQTGDPNVIVAVVDTGVAYEDFETFRQAPDLAGTSFVPGYDFVNDDSHPNDDHGHGTHVTGTIAQSTNNGMGVAGVAFGCSIMAVKVLDDQGDGGHFDIADGIYFAVDHGAKVINISLGGGEESITVRDAVAYAYRQGVTVVCAAGNEFLEGNAVNYPAAYDRYCIAVGATRYDETRSYYSNTGSYVDVVSPGGDLLVDQNRDGYRDGVLQQTFKVNPSDLRYWFFQGTSMAAAHVSGAAALLVSNGVTKPDQVRAVIEKTAKDRGTAGWDEQYGWGLIDVGAALRYRVNGDLNGDLSVNLADVDLLVSRWLRYAERFPAADLNGDGFVNLVDFAILAQSWSP